MLTLERIARDLGGELVGRGSLEIHGIASIERAGPTDLAPLDESRFLASARTSRAGALLVSRRVSTRPTCDFIVVDHALPALNRVMELLDLVRPTPPAGIHATAVVDAAAHVDATARVGPYCVVEAGASIGARTVLESHVVAERGVVLGSDGHVAPGAVLHEGLVAGDRVRIGANAVLSRPGFAYSAGPAGPVRLYHIGRVVLEDDVHIGAGATIDRARFDETRVGRYTALDNLVHVGHNCSIGARSFVAAQAGLAGGARIGEDCEIGGQVGIGERCGVGDRCRVAGKAGLIRMFGDDQTLLGYPALPRRESLRMTAALRRMVDPSRRR